MHTFHTYCPDPEIEPTLPGEVLAQGKARVRRRIRLQLLVAAQFAEAVQLFSLDGAWLPPKIHKRTATERHDVDARCRYQSSDRTWATESKGIGSGCSRPWWFLLRIFVDGTNAMVMVNGEKVSETDQLKPPDHGSIGFQQHTPGGHLEYREARIKETRWR